MGSAASSHASADAQHRAKDSNGRHIWQLRRVSSQASDKDAAAVPQHQETGGALHRGRSKARRESWLGKGDKRATQSADSTGRRVRSKRRHASPNQHKQQQSRGRGDAHVTVNLRTPSNKQLSAAVPTCCSDSPEVAAVFQAATLPAVHLSIRTGREQGDSSSRRKDRRRGHRAAAPLAAPAEQPAAAEASVRRQTPPRQCPPRQSATAPHIPMQPPPSSSGGASSMAATVHSLQHSLHRCSIRSGQHQQQQPAAAAPHLLNPTTSIARAQPAALSIESPHTPITDATSRLDAMSMSDGTQQPAHSAATSIIASPPVDATALLAAAAVATPTAEQQAQRQRKLQDLSPTTSSPALDGRLPSNCFTPGAPLPPRTPLSSGGNLPASTGGTLTTPGRQGSYHSRSARRRPLLRGRSGSAAPDSAEAAGVRTSPSSRGRHRRCCRRQQQQEQEQCITHPLDGTPQSMLQRGWPSSGRLRTVSTDSTWLLPLGAAAGATTAEDVSDSEWSALEVRGHNTSARLSLRYDSDDSDSDSEFWGGLAARAASAKQRRQGLGIRGRRLSAGSSANDLGASAWTPASGVDASSLSFSRAAAAAQHPIFDLSDPEEAVMAQNAALYEELLR